MYLKLLKDFKFYKKELRSCTENIIHELYGNIMKIYKIAQEFQFIPQNPSAPPNNAISLQNMQNAMGAIGVIDDIIAAANQVNASITKLEDVIGAGDLGLKQKISDTLSASLERNSAIALLMQMNLLPSISTLFNSGEYDKIKMKITHDVHAIQAAPRTEAAGQADISNLV